MYIPSINIMIVAHTNSFLFADMFFSPAYFYSMRNAHAYDILEVGVCGGKRNFDNLLIL